MHKGNCEVVFNCDCGNTELKPATQLEDGTYWFHCENCGESWEEDEHWKRVAGIVKTKFASKEEYDTFSAYETEWEDVAILPLKPADIDWKSEQQTIAFDFDGVIHSYTGAWTHSGEVNDGPVEGVLETIQSYMAHGYRVVIFTCRAHDLRGTAAVKEWLKKHGFPDMLVTKEKPHAVMYIDDRAFQFKGQHLPTIRDIKRFRPWNRS